MKTETAKELLKRHLPNASAADIAHFEAEAAKLPQEHSSDTLLDKACTGDCNHCAYVSVCEE